MGYTHYWYLNPDLNNTGKYSRAKAALVPIIDMCEDVLGEREWGGLPLPIANSDEVYFNGIGGEGHEVFCLHKIIPQPSTEKGTFYFDFCKTAHKPYDKAVVACLLSLKYDLGDDIRVFSDGGLNDWEEGQKIFETVRGVKVELSENPDSHEILTKEVWFDTEAEASECKEGKEGE